MVSASHLIACSAVQCAKQTPEQGTGQRAASGELHVLHEPAWPRRPGHVSTYANPYQQAQCMHRLSR